MKSTAFAMFVFACALAAILIAALANAAQPNYRLYCTVGSDTEYFATFDSGKSDKTTCSITGSMWQGFLKETYKTEVKCWCSPEVQA